ncbi:MAG: hypothetical protein ISS66_09470 [Desulfobacteraceae bacterium]|nr:hypothetical protein [Desulfobacteraceae bacterium]
MNKSPSPPEDRGQRTEGRWQRTEVRGPAVAEAMARRQMAEGPAVAEAMARRQMAEDGWQPRRIKT